MVRRDEIYPTRQHKRMEEQLHRAVAANDFAGRCDGSFRHHHQPGAVVNVNANVGLEEDELSQSALHLAAQAGPLVTMVEVILQAPGVNVDVRDFGGATPLDVACGNLCLPIVQALLEAGADPKLGRHLGRDASFQYHPGRVGLPPPVHY